MANKQDLVVKMTINSQDFDNGLKRAKGSMQKMNVDVSNLAKSFIKGFASVASSVGIGMTAIEGFKKLMRATEQSADAMDREMKVLTTSVDKFFQSARTGNLDSFINGLSDIAKNAREAYNALDALGTMKMWSGARVSMLQAQIAEDRVVVNAKTTTDDERKAAQDRIALNMQKIQALSGDLVTATENAIIAQLRNMSGSSKNDVSDAMLESFVAMFESGTLKAETEAFRKAHSYQKTESYIMPGGEGVPAYRQEYYTTAWDSEENRKIFDAMNALATITEGAGGWKDYYDLIKELGAQRTTVAGLANRATQALNKGAATGGTTTKTDIEEAMKLTEAQLMEYLSRKMQNEILAGDRAKDSMVIDIEIPEEDIIEEDTEAICEAVIKAREEMALLALETQAAFSAASQLGAAFINMGKIADGTLGDVLGMIGQVIQQLTQTITTMMALAGAETVEGVADLFANTPGGLFTKLAVAGAGLAGILGIIASAKSAFAGSFAEGGIVGGSSYSGDRLWARVNSGEMILNRSQQAALMNGGGQVRFVIEGSQLKGVLDNYDSIESL